jgi:hypothetical protein
MLTKDEQKLLEALKAHMDDEQKEALSAASEEDIKGFLKETRRELEKEMAKPKSQLQMMREMSFGEFMQEYGGNSIIQAVIVYWFAKMTGSKKGCGCLIFIVLIILAAIGTIMYMQEGVQ